MRSITYETFFLGDWRLAGRHSSSSCPSCIRWQRSASAAMASSWVIIRIVRPSSLVQLGQQLEDIESGFGVEVPGRLVGQQQRGSVIRARAIAARCISPPLISRRPVRGSMEQIRHDRASLRHGASPPCGGESSSRRSADHRRRQDVLDRRQFGQQMIELENDSDVVVAIAVSSGAGRVVDAFTAK